MFNLNIDKCKRYVRELKACKKLNCDFSLEGKEVSEFCDYIQSVVDENKELKKITNDKSYCDSCDYKKMEGNKNENNKCKSKQN